MILSRWNIIVPPIEEYNFQTSRDRLAKCVLIIPDHPLLIQIQERVRQVTMESIVVSVLLATPRYVPWHTDTGIYAKNDWSHIDLSQYKTLLVALSVRERGLGYLESFHAWSPDISSRFQQERVESGAIIEFDQTHPHSLLTDQKNRKWRYSCLMAWISAKIVKQHDFPFISPCFILIFTIIVATYSRNMRNKLGFFVF